MSPLPKHTADQDPTPPEHVLVTGFPAFTAKRLARKIVTDDEQARMVLLVRAKFMSDAKKFVASWPDAQKARTELVTGDVCHMDLGLSGDEYKALTGRVTTIHHLAGIYYLGVEKAMAQRVNVGGTRGVIDLAADCRKLRRLCHYSTALVSGTRKGVVMESELDEGQRFRNFYEETKFEAEMLMREAQRRLPVSIFRPSVIVGDSRTGEIDKFDGPYFFTVLIVENPLDMHLPLPGRGVAPMHLVPIDFLVDAAYTLSLDDRAAGGTFHIVDPSPLAAKAVYDLIAEHAHRKRPRGFIPSGIAKAILKAPGLGRLARAPLSFLEAWDHLAFYNARNTLDLLRGTGIECPCFSNYVENLVRYVKEVHAARRQKHEDEIFDPFD